MFSCLPTRSCVARAVGEFQSSAAWIFSGFLRLLKCATDAASPAPCHIYHSKVFLSFFYLLSSAIILCFWPADRRIDCSGFGSQRLLSYSKRDI